MILLALIAMFSGFAVLLFHGWTPVYQANLMLHPIISLAALAAAGLFTRRRLSVQGSHFIRYGLDLPVLLSFILALAWVSDAAKSVFFGALVFLTLFLLFGLQHILKRGPAAERTASLVSYLELILWLYLNFSGIAILTQAQAGGVKYLFAVHRYAAVIFFVFFVGHFLVRAFTNTREKLHLPRADFSSKKTGLAAIAVIAIMTFLLGWDHWRPDPTFTISLSTIPLEYRQPEDKTVFFSDPAFSPAGLDLTTSCTKLPGCHRTLERGFLSSNHNISMTTPHFQKNLELLASEIGEKNSLICAGCHYPYALFDASKDYGYFKNHNNLSCSFCHMIDQVRVTNEDARRSSYTIRPPTRHLRLFLKDGRETVPDKWTAFLLRLSPTNHGRAFSPRVLKEDAFCVACHHHQIRLPAPESLRRPKCTTCHMQPQRDIGMEGRLANHFMPGANLCVPYFAGRPDAVQTIADWVNGRFPLHMKGWENMWEPRMERNASPSKAVWLYMLFETMGEPAPGRDITLRLLTTNSGMEHQFPAAPLDLIEVWLELRVLDSAGMLIYANGLTGEDEPVAPEAHTMGGYMLGMDEKIVTKNRVWQIKKKVVHRILDPGRQTRDEFKFRIPDNCQGPLKIMAQWKYRKLSQDFALWAYGAGAKSPIVTVGTLSGELQLKTPEAPAPDSGGSAKP